jgi:hypothetical protein
MSQSPIKGTAKPVVVRGLDPPFHPLLKDSLFERWIAGSSPATTGYEFGGLQ